MNKTKLLLGFCALLATGASAAKYAANYTSQTVWYNHPTQGCTQTTIDDPCFLPMTPALCAGDRIESPSFGLQVFNDQSCNVFLYREQ